MKQIWIANRQEGAGAGTKEDPFDASKPENFLALFKNPEINGSHGGVEWYWLEGEYEQLFWEWERCHTLMSNVKHIGAGPNKTIWRLRGAQCATGTGAAFASDHYIEEAGVFDGTIDLALDKQPKHKHCIDSRRYNLETPLDLECWPSEPELYDPSKEYQKGEAVKQEGHGWFVCVKDGTREINPHLDGLHKHWAGDGIGTVWGFRAQGRNLEINNVVFIGWGTPLRWTECFCCSIGSGRQPDQKCEGNRIIGCTFEKPYMDNKDGTTICNCSALNQTDDNVIKDCLVDLPPNNEAKFIYSHAFSAAQIINCEARWVDNFTYYEPGTVGPKIWDTMKTTVKNGRAINCMCLGCLLFHDYSWFGELHFIDSSWIPWAKHGAGLVRLYDEVSDSCGLKVLEIENVQIEWPGSLTGNAPIWLFSGSGKMKLQNVMIREVRLTSDPKQDHYLKIDTKRFTFDQLTIGCSYMNEVPQEGFDGVHYSNGTLYYGAHSGG